MPSSIRQVALCTLLLCLGIPFILSAQQKVTELSIAEWRTEEHILGPRIALHISKSEWRALPLGRNSVELTIVVSPAGYVESASVFGTVTTHADEAIAVEMARTFKPWIVNGVPTRVQLRDGVELYPPEEWLEPHVPFPTHWDLTALSVHLKRTRCYGLCPAYDVTITGDGAIHFIGSNIGVAIPGDHIAHISPDAVRSLVRKFETSDFFSAKDSYTASVTDNPSHTLTLTLGGTTKSVYDYVGLRSGLPFAIKDLEDEVDRVAGTDRWVKGTDDTVSSLGKEEWPFTAATDANLSLYDTALSTHNRPLVERYLNARGPVASPDPKRSSPICIATSIGDLALVTRMLEQGSKPAFPRWVPNQCLTAAALGGNLALVQLWLDRNADPNANPTVVDGDWELMLRPLAAAMLSGNPDVVRLLLQRHADIHLPAHFDDSILEFALERSGQHAPEIVPLLIQAGADVNALNGSPPLPAIFDIEFVPPATIKALIAGGSNVNARSPEGYTPLIRFAYREEIVRELLADGADPTVVDKFGTTALSAARSSSCTPCAVLIQEALKEKFR